MDLTRRDLLRLGAGAGGAWLAGCAGSGGAEQSADLVLRGGRVTTLDPLRPEASAVPPSP